MMKIIFKKSALTGTVIPACFKRESNIFKIHRFPIETSGMTSSRGFRFVT